ncbi:MAG: ABC-F family ATP-binding cassette domain-containing protein, partial [Bdellovibrionales bacterium]|nr:ABC-F family ATP-binding cassette domain-containing protein [Bdellovibrionales bacterium]
MLTISNLSKSYGSHELLREASLVIASDERIGLIGRNGYGKSTLLKMILNEESWDSGELKLQSGVSVGYLQQHLNFTGKTIHEEVCQALPVQEGGYREEYKAEQILTGLGFHETQFTLSPTKFSGGFQIRILLAKLLVSEPDLLLLDEPTNYLDITSLRWLESFLRNWPKALILITHDRRFLDAIVTHTVLIHRCKLKKLSGGTEKIYEQIAEEEEIHSRTVKNQQKRQADTIRFIERFRSKASKAKQVQSRVKALAREEKLEDLSDIESLDFSFHPLPFAGKRLMNVEGIEFEYIPSKPLFQNLNFVIAPGEKIAVIGPNGKGKSTLLEVLAGVRAPTKGSMSRHADCDFGYFGQTNINRLSPHHTVEDEVLQAMPIPNRSRARGICGAMMFSGDLALKKTEVLSG